MEDTIIRVRVGISEVSRAALATLTMDRGTQFFTGWIKRFRTHQIFLRSHLNETEHLNL
jgi:hypothetical protein